MRALVLDFDGTLVESGAAKTEAFNALFRPLPVHAEMMAFHAANPAVPRRTKLQECTRLLGQGGDEAVLRDLETRFESLVRERVRACTEVPGAGALVEAFAPRVPTYVASVTPEPELRDHLAHRGWLPLLKGAFGDPPCPKPEALRRVVASERILPHELVVVGDSVSDLEAAKSIGARFVGRDSGQPFPRGMPLHRDLHVVAAELELEMA